MSSFLYRLSYVCAIVGIAYFAVNATFAAPNAARDAVNRADDSGWKVLSSTVDGVQVQVKTFVYDAWKEASAWLGLPQPEINRAALANKIPDTSAVILSSVTLMALAALFAALARLTRKPRVIHKYDFDDLDDDDF